VQKSRTIESDKLVREKKLAETRARMFEEQDVEAEDAALTVGHSAEDIAEGETIMVLKDAPVLADDDVNEGIL